MQELDDMSDQMLKEDFELHEGDEGYEDYRNIIRNHEDDYEYNYEYYDANGIPDSNSTVTVVVSAYSGVKKV